MKKLATTAAVLALGAATVAVAPAASAKPDTGCMQAGIAFLKDAGLFSTVAKGGLPIATAVSVGVKPRAGTDVALPPAPAAAERRPRRPPRRRRQPVHLPLVLR